MRGPLPSQWLVSLQSVEGGDKQEPKILLSQLKRPVPILLPVIRWSNRRVNKFTVPKFILDQVTWYIYLSRLHATCLHNCWNWTGWNSSNWSERPLNLSWCLPLKSILTLTMCFAMTSGCSKPRQHFAALYEVRASQTPKVVVHLDLLYMRHKHNEFPNIHISNGSRMAQPTWPHSQRPNLHIKIRGFRNMSINQILPYRIT